MESEIPTDAELAALFGDAEDVVMGNEDENDSAADVGTYAPIDDLLTDAELADAFADVDDGSSVTYTDRPATAAVDDTCDKRVQTPLLACGPVTAEEVCHGTDRHMRSLLRTESANHAEQRTNIGVVHSSTLPGILSKSKGAKRKNEMFGREQYIEGVIGFDDARSTQAKDIVYNPDGSGKPHNFVLVNGGTLGPDVDPSFFNAGCKFPAIPHAFEVGFIASPSQSDASVWVVRDVLHFAAHDSGYHGVLHLAAHMIGWSTNKLTAKLIKAGYNVATDRMQYTKTVRATLFENGIIPMDFMDCGFGKGAKRDTSTGAVLSVFRHHYSLLMEILDCVQWQENVEMDRAYTAQWNTMHDEAGSEIARDKARRKALSEIREHLTKVGTPLTVTVGRHPLAVMYFCAPQLPVMGPLFGLEILFGVYVEQLWALYDDIVACDHAAAQARNMHPTAWGMCFADMHRRTHCSYAKYLGGNEFNFAWIRSFPTIYTPVHGQRIPLALPEPSYCAIAGFPDICKRIGTQGMAEIMVYNLMKQAATEDQSACLTLEMLYDRMGHEMMGSVYTEEYKRTRHRYYHAAHEAIETYKTTLMQRCRTGIGPIHTNLATNPDVQRAVGYAAVCGLVCKGVLFMERPSVAEIYAQRQISGLVGELLVPVSATEYEDMAYIDLPEDLVDTCSRVWSTYVCALWSDRSRYRVYLPNAYYEEEAIIRSLAQHTVRQQMDTARKPRFMNAFYKEAEARKWDLPTMRAYADDVNHLLVTNAPAIAASPQEGEPLAVTIARTCRAQGLHTVRAYANTPSPDQAIAIEATHRLGYGVTVLEGFGGTGKTNIGCHAYYTKKPKGFLGSVYMNTQRRNLERALGGYNTPVLNMDRTRTIHSATCTNSYMREVLNEMEHYKKDEVDRLHAYGYLCDVDSYKHCPFEGVRELFIDEHTTVPRTHMACMLTIASNCMHKLNNITISGNLNQLGTFVPGTGSHLTLGLGYMSVTRQWRNKSTPSIANIHAIADNRPDDFRSEAADMADSTCPIVHIPCTRRWKQAYYQNHSDDVVSLLVKDFEDGHIPIGTLVVIPNNTLAGLVNLHLATAELRARANSTSAAVKRAALEDLERLNIPKIRTLRGKHDTVMAPNDTFRGMHVITTGNLEWLGIANRTKAVCGEDVMLQVLHIKCEALGELHWACYDAVCETVYQHVTRGEEADNMDVADCAPHTGLAKDVPEFVTLVSSIVKKSSTFANVVSHSMNNLKRVVDDHARAHRLMATAMKNMMAANITKKEVRQRFACEGSGRPSHEAYSDLHVAPWMIDYRLLLHGDDSPEWKRQSRGAASSGSAPHTAANPGLTEWFQGSDACRERIKAWCEKEGFTDEDSQAALEPLMWRVIKKTLAALLHDTDDEEAQAIALRLEHEVRNSFVTERSNPEIPTQAALRRGLEDFYARNTTYGMAVNKNDYVAVMPPRGHRLDANANASQPPLLRFIKLYQERDEETYENIIYYPATSYLLSKLQPSFAQTYFSVQSQESRKAAIVLPYVHIRNEVFVACTRASELRIYAPDGVVAQSIATEPHVPFGVLGVKLRYEVAVEFHRNGRARERVTMFEKKCIEQEAAYNEQAAVRILDGETAEDAHLRLVSMSRTDGFVLPTAAPLPLTTSENMRWLLKHWAENGDTLFRPNGQPCNTIGMSEEDAANDALWKTEYRAGNTWGDVSGKFSTDAEALAYIQEQTSAYQI